MKKYKVVTYTLIEAEKEKPLILKEAKQEKEQLELMQPENIYKIEEIK